MIILDVVGAKIACVEVLYRMRSNSCCDPETLRSSVSSVVNMVMDWRSHARTTGTALKNWFIAQCYDSLAVAVLWLVGLWIIGIPWAPLWAILGGVLQFIPNFGVMISLMDPRCWARSAMTTCGSSMS